MTGEIKAWENVEDEALAAVQGVLAPAVKAATDQMYVDIMEAVQDYFIDNVKFNIASRIDCAEREAHRASDACATVQRERDEAREEVERLRKLVAPQWFYYGDECSSDRCRDSIHECIDEDFLYDNRGEGSHVLEIATATNLPTIWAAVHFFTDEEKDARQDDEDYEVTEFATKVEAEAFLARYEAAQ